MKELARLGNWKVVFENISDDYGVLSVAGPKSKEILSKMHPRFGEKFGFFTSNKVSERVIF